MPLSQGEPIGRVLGMFALATLLPCAFYVFMDVQGLRLMTIVFLISLAVSYALVIFIALPVYLLIGRRFAMTPARVLISATLIGAIPGMVVAGFALTGPVAEYATANGNVLAVHGERTLYAYLSVLRIVVLTTALGLLTGFIFWLIHPKASPGG